MALLYCTSMDHYGEVAAVDLENGVVGAVLPALIGDGWSDYPKGSATAFRAFSGTYGVYAPPWGARQGDYALVADSTTGVGGAGGSVTWVGSEGFRLAIPGALVHERVTCFAFSLSALPSVAAAHGMICNFLDENGAMRFTLGVNPSGRLVVYDDTPLLIPNTGSAYTQVPVAVASSSSPVIAPETWYYLSIYTKTYAGVPTFDIDVYVGDIVPANKVISGTTLDSNGTGTNEVGIIGFLPISAGLALSGSGGHINIDTTVRAVRDIVLCDVTGSYNNAVLGPCFVSAQEFRAEDDEGDNWTAYPRAKFGTGVLDHATTNTGVRFADSASLDIGSSDFTLESEVRFDTLPGAGEYMNLVSKWREAAGYRSYGLYYDADTASLVWDVSTDGSATTTVKSVPWVPVVQRYYHVAVVRSSSQTMFFIDGVQLGVPVADANTYYAAASYLGVGVEFNSDGTPATAGRFDGWMDETRLTIGVARYTSDFTRPAAAHGRNSTDDTSFASVVLLLGYDGSITDESGYARTATVAGTDPVAAATPDDGTFSYDVLNDRPVVDDTYIEAALLPATGVFTFDDVPTVGETMTVGTQTYTWVSSFSSNPVDEVLIGANVAACITNIIAAINNGSGEGTLYGTGTAANTDAQALTFLSPQFSVVALSAGAAGNSIATTETMADGYFGAATLTGGQSIPSDSDFSIERLPIDATGVLAMQVTARTYKTDAGSAQMRFDLVGPQGTVGAGTAFAPELNAAWTRQVFEEDPDTSAAPTVSTINSGRIRVKRTA